jgi:hypothetical protein
VDERLQAILNPAGTLGRELAQAGLMDYQKTLVGVMEAAGAAEMSREDKIAGAVFGRIFGAVVPGGGYLINAAQAVNAVEQSHKEAIEQMEARNVAGFETGTLQLQNPRDKGGDNITMRYWVDVSAVEFDGKPKVYMEPADSYTKKLVESLDSSDDDYASRKLSRLERIAEDIVESKALKGVHNSIAGGQNYSEEISNAIQDIQNDYFNGRLVLSAVEVDAPKQVAQLDEGHSAKQTYTTLTV